ncbi:MAG: ARMT1-like domain-containing protein [Paludibacter sp.]|nr:ARMT1-like domain-containing protein [Paludibacter sp.]
MNKFQMAESLRNEFVDFYNTEIRGLAVKTTPEIHRVLNREFCRLISNNDPYSEEKQMSNKLTLQLYKHFRTEVLEAMNPFKTALKLSIAGNIMDYGVAQDFDIHKTIDTVLGADFAIDHSVELEERIKSAKKILYLGDNAGEIVFDKLFIELIMPPGLTFAVRGSAVLNDALEIDAREVGMDMVADVINNGYDAPSTVLSECSPEFLEVYNEADLIISKGQGNFEGLMDENDPRIFFLLMVKCDVVAEKMSVPQGSFVVYNKTI